jgi:hypothetical protein
MVMSVWDDEYRYLFMQNNKLQKKVFQEILKDFKRKTLTVVNFFVVNGWDSATLVETLFQSRKKCKRDHIQF